MKNRRFFVIGAGRFGKKACLHLLKGPRRQVVAVDPDKKSLLWAKEAKIEFYQLEGVSFLVHPPFKIDPDDFIIPALPIHLAAYWVLEKRPYNLDLTIGEMPEDITVQLPGALRLSDRSYATTHANFLCPEGCKEGKTCPVTGMARKRPLYEILKEIKTNRALIHVIQSRQLGPGMGGYKMKELLNLMDLPWKEHQSIMIATACRCHGIVSNIVST